MKRHKHKWEIASYGFYCWPWCVVGEHWWRKGMGKI